MTELRFYLRMKIIVVILQGVIVLALAYSQEKCQKEEQRTQYHIYNTNVEIKIYPCVITDRYSAQTCENRNYRKVVNDYPSIINKCIYQNYVPGVVTINDSVVFDKANKKRIFVNLCELTASAKLLEGTVETSQVVREYTSGRYYDPTYQHFVFWSTEPCQDVQVVHRGFFHVWTDRYGHKYIRNEQISLRLTEKIYFCGYEMWKTDYEGIIVSTNSVESSIVADLSGKFQSALPDDCDVTTAAVDNSLLQRESVLQKQRENSLTLLDYLMYVLYATLCVGFLTIILTLFLSVQLLSRLDSVEIKHDW